jgi:hypothetical protein
MSRSADRRLVKLARIVLALASFSLVIPPPAAAHHTPSHASCAPVQHCLFAGCWYDLLNNPDFSGTHPSCTSWANLTTTNSSVCFNEAAAVITPGGSNTRQNFSVPSGTTGTLELHLEFGTIGTPTSLSDRLVFYLYEGFTFRESITIYPMNSPFSCHQETHYFDDFNYAGKNLRLDIRAFYATPGVKYHINYIQLYAY